MTNANGLDVNFDDIDLNYPRLNPGVYELLLKEATRVTTNETDYVKVAIETTTDATDTQGKVHPAPFKTNTTVWLKPFADGSMDDIDKGIAAIVRAAGLKGVKKSDFLASPAILNGKTAMCRVGKFTSKKDGSERNSFNFFVKK